MRLGVAYRQYLRAAQPPANFGLIQSIAQRHCTRIGGARDELSLSARVNDMVVAARLHRGRIAHCQAGIIIAARDPLETSIPAEIDRSWTL